MATNLVDLQVNYLSKCLSEYSGHPRDDIEAKIRDGVNCGLCGQTWIVEEADGTRSHQPVIDRVDFFDWWMRDGLFPIPYEDEEKVWPRTMFEDRVIEQSDELCYRWRAQAGGARMPAFAKALDAACDASAAFRRSDMARSLAREDFVTWYKDWPFSSTLSAVANTRRAVLADELWPEPVGVEPWTDMPLREAVRRAYRMEFPDGLLAGTSKKVRNLIIGNRLEQHGVRRPDERSFRRYLKEHTGR